MIVCGFAQHRLWIDASELYPIIEQEKRPGVNAKYTPSHVVITVATVSFYVG